MEVQHIERLLYYWKYFLFGWELQYRSGWRATVRKTHWPFFDATLCAYTTSPHIHRYFVCNYTWQQNSHTLWMYTTHQTSALLPILLYSIRTKFGTTLHIVVSFQSFVYTLINYYKWYYHTSLRVCYQVGKKNHKLRKKIVCKMKYK